MKNSSVELAMGPLLALAVMFTHAMGEPSIALDVVLWVDPLFIFLLGSSALATPVTLFVVDEIIASTALIGFLMCISAMNGTRLVPKLVWTLVPYVGMSGIWLYDDLAVPTRGWVMMIVPAVIIVAVAVAAPH